MKFISIVLPTFNRQKMIFRIIKNLNHQKFFNFELIIIDQSKKKLNKIFSKFKNKKFLVRYIHLDEPNVCYARNLGVKISKYKYIFFLDDDILIKDNFFFKKLSLYFSKNKNVKIIQGQMIEKNLKRMRFSNKNDFSNRFDKEIDSIDLLITGNCAIEKKTFISVKGFNELYQGRTFGFEDGDLGKRLIKKGYKIKFVPKFLVYHHNYQKGGNRDNDKSRNSKINLTSRLVTFFQYNGEHFSGLEKLYNYLFIFRKILKKDYLSLWSFIIIPYSIIEAYIIAKSRRKRVFNSIFNV